MQGTVKEVISHLRNLAPELARREHIKIARKGLERVLAKTPNVPYRIIVDGKSSTTERSVKPFGVISYVFIRFEQAARFALKTAEDLSPVQSGRYKLSWTLISDNQDIEKAKRIILVNFQPYARKIHLRGARLAGVAPGIVEKVRQITSRRFSLQVNLDIQFIELGQGLGYTLKRNYVQIRRSGTKRLHTEAGSKITYPALIITPRRD